MEFQSIAVKKLNALINDPSFKKITSVDKGKIQIEFDDSRLCEIDNWGRVTWLDERLTLNQESETPKAGD